MTSYLDVTVQQDLDHIRSEISKMGDLAASAVEAAVRAVIERDRQLAFAVILRDQYIDESEKRLDRLCLEFLVRHQPAASLLRFAYAAIKINLELERVGDYAESIARESLRLTNVKGPLPMEELQHIAGVAVPLLRDAIRAFLDQDPEIARRTIEADDGVDVLRDSLNLNLTQAYRDGEIPFESLNPLIHVTRRLERVSDQARNISMETLYMCTGEYAKHPGSEAIRVLFLDENNSCLSVMAEAIGTSLCEAGFVFSSAGVDLEPVDPRTVKFLASKGLDASRAFPKTIIQVPNAEHQHVIVLLSPEAKRAISRGPRKAVVLDWAIDNPQAFAGTDAEVDAIYETTFQFIAGQLRDLVSAIRNINEK